MCYSGNKYLVVDCRLAPPQRGVTFLGDMSRAREIFLETQHSVLVGEPAAGEVAEGEIIFGTQDTSKVKKAGDKSLTGKQRN